MKIWRVKVFTLDHRQFDFLVRNVRSENGAKKKALAYLNKWHKGSTKDLNLDIDLQAWDLSFGEREVMLLAER